MEQGNMASLNNCAGELASHSLCLRADLKGRLSFTGIYRAGSCGVITLRARAVALAYRSIALGNLK